MKWFKLKPIASSNLDNGKWIPNQDFQARNFNKQEFSHMDSTPPRGYLEYRY